MRIRYKHRKTRIEQRKKWHKRFIILPKNINDELHFLCYLARRLDVNYDFTLDFMDRIFEPMWASYEYKSLQDYIVEKLKSK